MKKNTQLHFSLLVGLGLTCCAPAATYHVATTGDDAAAGSQDAPYRNIQKAAAVAQPGDTVLIHSGVYRETVRPIHSGLPGQPITYKPFERDDVIISGTEAITGWTAGEGKIWQAPMAADFYPSAINYANQIFVDGQMMTLARWPNTSLDLSMPTKAEITQFISKTRDADDKWTTGVVVDDKLAPATDDYYVGAEIYFQPNKDAWSWTFSGVVTAQKGTELTFDTRNICGKDGMQHVYAIGSRYYLFNKRELLDAPGEWWLDKAAGKLHLWVPTGDDPNQHVVEARKRDWAFYLDGLSHITIQGFKLFACTITTDGEAGDGQQWDENGNDRYPWRSGDSLPSSHHVLLDGLVCKYPSHFTDVSGHFFFQWGLNTGITIAGMHQTIQNCHVQYSAGNGITSYGRDNKILNNLIEDTAYMAVDNAFISTLGGAGAFDFEIAYNTGRRTGRSGIGMRQMQNSDPTKLVSRIHHNDIGDFMLQDWDGGGTYTANQDAHFVRIDHNWFHDGMGENIAGIYVDYSKNWIMNNNVLWNVSWGIHLEGQHESGVVNALVYNNTVLGHDNFIGIGNGEAAGSFYYNNLHTRDLGKAGHGARDAKNNWEWDRQPGSSTDPLFVNAAAADFRLTAESPVRGKGIAIPTCSTIQPGNPDIPVTPGNDPMIDGVMDLGAYTFGGESWTAGCTLKAGITPPVAPSALAGTAPSATQINLTWKDNSSNEAGFTLERSDGQNAYQRIATISANSSEYYDMGLNKNTAYTYQLRAINRAGESDWSEAVTLTTPETTHADARIARTATPPTMTRELDAIWESVSAHPIAIINNGTVDSTDDLSGSWKALWDDQALYLLIEVTDDHVETEPAEAWFANDGVEIYLDLDNSKKKDYDAINDFQIALVWGATAPTFGGKSAKLATALNITQIRTEKGYRTAIVLPWAAVHSGGRPPVAGSLLGFDVHLNDRDDGAFQGKRAWFAQSNMTWMDASLFGTVELVAESEAETRTPQ